jgi:hypothetical protein
MARTRDPNDEIVDFDNAAARSIDLWARTQAALTGADLDVRKTVSLDAFIRVAVAWEGFRSRWHVAAINRDSSVFRTDIEQRFRASTRDGRFAELESHLHVSSPCHSN